MLRLLCIVLVNRLEKTWELPIIVFPQYIQLKAYYILNGKLDPFSARFYKGT